MIRRPNEKCQNDKQNPTQKIKEPNPTKNYHIPLYVFVISGKRQRWVWAIC